MVLSNEDRRDIEQSFHVLDDDRVGTISMDHFYTLWLGLGFDDTISRADLAAHVPQDRHKTITLEDVLRIASCYSRNRESELAILFQLLSGHGKLSITASDLIVLANEVGDTLSEDEAQAMMGEKECWTVDDLRSALFR